MPEDKDWVHELEIIMARLRAPDGCPWDHEQTHETLTKYLVEEAYEFIDAVEDGDDHHMADELGDLLLQVVFHSQIAREDDRFDLQQVARMCCEKLIRRHPHVYGETAVDGSAGVLKQWEELKRSEKSHVDRTSHIDGVPRHLPALSQAEKIQKKAARVGFDWPDLAGPLAKIQEEIEELKEHLPAPDAPSSDLDAARADALEDEFGDLLFAVVNLGRFAKVDPEKALRRANAKFRRRFLQMEADLDAAGRDMRDCTLPELDALWDAAKAREKQP